MAHLWLYDVPDPVAVEGDKDVVWQEIKEDEEESGWTLAEPEGMPFIWLRCSAIMAVTD